MEDRRFARLPAFLDYSWNGYRRVRRGVKKRVVRHMSALECRNMDEYLEKLTDDPPDKELDIVFLRNNLLTYCNEELLEEPLIKVVEALRPDGFLVIGAKETMPESAIECVTRYDGCIFRKT